MSAVADVATRLRAQVPAVTVFEHGVPWAVGQAAPVDRYTVVRGDPGVVVSDDLADRQTLQDDTVWVTSVAEGPVSAGASENEVGKVCDWLAGRNRDALRRWRPPAGWFPVNVASRPLAADEDVPDRVVVTAVSQWSIRNRG